MRNTSPALPSNPARKLNARSVALRISAVYLAFAALWIAFSDRLLSAVHDPKRIVLFETIEDSCFAIITGFLFYFLIARFVRQRRLV